MELSYSGPAGLHRVADHIATESHLWWDPRDPGQTTFWDNRIVLGNRFFDEIITSPVPVDMNTLRALKRSSLGLDIYYWVTYRLFGLTEPVKLSWVALNRQFAKSPRCDPNALSWFRRDFLRELRKIRTAWAGFNFRTVPGFLVLLPAPPQIPPA